MRRSVIEGDRTRGRKALDVPEDATLLLVFGGSLGAQHLNERVASLKNELLSRENLYVLHSTGADGFEDTEHALALTPEEARRYRVQPYIDNMGDMLAAADLVLSRSGASSVAEIAALAVPSVLVPYPHATADHQTTNARYLVDAGAGVLCADADIDAIKKDALRKKLARVIAADLVGNAVDERLVRRLAGHCARYHAQGCTWLGAGPCCRPFGRRGRRIALVRRDIAGRPRADAVGAVQLTGYRQCLRKEYTSTWLIPRLQPPRPSSRAPILSVSVAPA